MYLRLSNNNFFFFKNFLKTSYYQLHKIRNILEGEARRSTEKELRQAMREASRGFYVLLKAGRDYFTNEGESMMCDVIDPSVINQLPKMPRSQDNWQKLLWFTVYVS